MSTEILSFELTHFIKDYDDWNDMGNSEIEYSITENYPHIVKLIGFEPNQLVFYPAENLVSFYLYNLNDNEGKTIKTAKFNISKIEMTPAEK